MHFFRRNLDGYPDLAQAVGNLIVAWSYVDAAAIYAFYKCKNITQSDAAEEYYKHGSGFGSRADMVKKAVNKSKCNWSRPVVDLIDSLAAHTQFRNKIVHGGWGDLLVINQSPLLKTAGLRLFDYRQNKPYRSIDCSAKDIYSQCDAVISIANQIFNVVDSEALGASQTVTQEAPNDGLTSSSGRA